VERVKRQPPPGVGDRPLGAALALGRVPRHQPRQCARCRIAQGLGLEELPLIEGGAGLQREAGEEVVPVQGRRLLQPRHTSLARLAGGVLVCFARRECGPERRHIHP